MMILASEEPSPYLSLAMDMSGVLGAQALALRLHKVGV